MVSLKPHSKCTTNHSRSYKSTTLIICCSTASAWEEWKPLKGRYLDNGILDFLVKEREAGRIRNLGFSYHGDIEVYDYLLSRHDEFKWDFVQIQLNYVDWKHAKETNTRNTDAEYLYGELVKRGFLPSLWNHFWEDVYPN